MSHLLLVFVTLLQAMLHPLEDMQTPLHVVAPPLLEFVTPLQVTLLPLLVTRTFPVPSTPKCLDARTSLVPAVSLLSDLVY